jgi:hypothetical protein
MPDPATTPAHEGGERERNRGVARLYAAHADDDWTQALARDWLAMDAEITRLREALAWAVAYINTELSMSGSRRGQNAAIDGVIDWVEKSDALLKDAALAGTSADAGARETVTIKRWIEKPGDVLGVCKDAIDPGFVTENGEKVKYPYSVAITVTPGKERGK